MKDNPQNQVKLSQLKIVVAIAEQKNFGEAALDLGISQSAVSHAIAALEDSLGVILFSRGRHGATLTPVGASILPHAQTVVEGIDAILREAAVGKGLERGKVRIATFRSIATRVLPEGLKQLRERFPGIVANLTEHENTHQVEQALREGRSDVGIITLPADKGITTWELLRDEYIVLLPPGTQLEGNQLTWEALAKQPLIMPPIDYVMMRPVYDHVNGLGYRLNVVNEIETDSATVNLVEQGLGGTILPRLAAEPIPKAIQVYSLPVPLERHIAVAILTDALQPPAVYALLEVLKS
ncbi:MAG: LysR family transcriptional regulator [Leptolyngbya foveolarum]|uniref:LysR family transcriptional regulator n=1 Tax=Leptolyngbya foveolarum TaxID=47253 RepID=A0A2W4W2W8_9CYAN|nr:MAG: LysR family transcriptional regulator [Leptolyngbya foveolarum]